MLQGSVSGADRLSKTLLTLANVAPSRAGRKSLSDSLRYLKQQAQQAAPVGKTKQLRQRVRQRVRTKNKVVISGRISLAAKHAHLVTLGTKKRFRKSIGGRFQKLLPAKQDFRNKGTGSMPANPFFRLAITSATNQAIKIMASKLKVHLAEEVRRAR